MAHEVEMINGVAQMAYAGDKPWHGLGVEVHNDLTPGQIMAKAGLDWEVEKVNSYIDVDGKKVLTGQQSLVRKSDNKILTNVGGDWNPVQNADAFEFFSEYVLAGDMEMNTAGSLKGGRNVFALAKVKESFDILGSDQVDSYLLFSNQRKRLNIIIMTVCVVLMMMVKTMLIIMVIIFIFFNCQPIFNIPCFIKGIIVTKP